MSNHFSMSWLESSSRWRKIKVVEGRSKSFTISCRKLRRSHGDLMTANTKLGSYLAANQWWQEQDAELE